MSNNKHTDQKSADKISTDDLINQLCGELKPIGKRCPYRRVSVWLLGSIIYLGFVVSYLGFRPDIAERLMEGVFIYEMGLAFSILVSASLASSWLSFPDCIQRDWMKIIATSLFFSFTLWVIAHSIEEGSNIMETMYVGHCATQGMVMQLLPILALVFITMKGNTTQPYWSMAMNILAVSCLGWIGLRLTCSTDQMGHSFFNHILPIAVIGAGLGFYARKLFKW